LSRHIAVQLPRILLLLLIIVLAGCRQSAQGTPTPSATTESGEIDIEMAVEPAPPTVGDAVLVVTLHSVAGTPIDGAQVAVRGDMNHAGMIPVLREGHESQEGTYRIPFEWTMGGDWIVTLDITLPDGQQVTRRFEMTIES
jgi:hypothetical protein